MMNSSEKSFPMFFHWKGPETIVCPIATSSSSAHIVVPKMIPHQKNKQTKNRAFGNKWFQFWLRKCAKLTWCLIILESKESSDYYDVKIKESTWTSPSVSKRILWTSVGIMAVNRNTPNMLKSVSAQCYLKVKKLFRGFWRMLEESD